MDNLYDLISVFNSLSLDIKEMDMETAIIIYEVNNVSIGFIVDNVEDVLSIDDKKISDSPSFGKGIDTSFIEKVAEVDNDVIMLLNFEKIFEAEELLEIGKLEKDNKQDQQKEAEL